MIGTPNNQATVSISNQKKETDQQGLCTIKRYRPGNIQKTEEEEEEDTKNEILIVEKGDDLCIQVNIHSYRSTDDAYIWRIFNDRGLYRPKEEVHIKGYVRLMKIKGEAKIPTYAQGIIDYIIYGSHSEQLQQSKVELNNYGAFDIYFTLPDNVNL
ncbi:unnamed protein product, partial [Rotaria magnacalcarata]